ncbi:MAG: hypothetical protein GYA33_12930 [Thermogutta sp.]|nr:hypothetical protein [Thermogutta sp.]
MKDVPENELFSAYLDGEITAEEQAQLEQLLAGSESARKLLEELRTQANLLQSLPRVDAPIDFADRVLGEITRRTGRGAKRQSPSEGDDPGIAEAPSVRSIGREQDGADSSPGGPWSPAAIFRRLAQPRNLGWALIAASLAVVIYMMDAARQFHDRRDGEVATAPQGQADRGGPTPSEHRIEPLPGDLAMESADEQVESAEDHRGVASRAEDAAAAGSRPDALLAARSPRPRSALDSAENLAHREPQAEAAGATEGMALGGHAGRGAATPAAPAEAQAAAGSPAGRRGPTSGDSGATVLRQYDLQGPPPMSQLPRMVPVEIVCRLTPEADPQAVAARVIQRRNSVPESEDSYGGWEFAAAETPAPGAAAGAWEAPSDARGGLLARSLEGGAAKPAEGAAEPSRDPGASPGRPDVRISTESKEKGGAVVVEFTGGLSQIEAVLAELEREPGQVADITLPTALGFVQGRIRESAAEGMMGAARRASPKAAPLAAIPSAPSAPAAPPQREKAGADLDSAAQHQVAVPTLYRVTIRLVPPPGSQPPSTSPPAGAAPMPE